MCCEIGHIELIVLGVVGVVVIGAVVVGVIVRFSVCDVLCASNT